MSGSCLHGKKSKICLSPLTSLPCPLCSLFLKSCPISLGRGFLGEGELFFFFCSWKPRLFTLGQVNVLKNNHHLLPLSLYSVKLD